MEQMYGDDRSISPEDFDRKCQEIIDKYGLGDKEFTENEMWDPRTDPAGLVYSHMTRVFRST